MPDSRDQESRLASFRWFYADLITSFGPSSKSHELLKRAFGETLRERFCGPGPWKAFRSGGHVMTPSADPAFLYQDIVVVLDESRGINNGQPSLHAACIAALHIEPSDTVLHIGVGTGYYTAILGFLAGQVLAYEIEPWLGEAARENLAEKRHVEVLIRSGAEGPLPAADVIYVSAGATEPLAVWMDALRAGGRLLFPLTPDKGFGGMLLVERLHAEGDPERYGARFITQATFIPCVGARDPKTAASLAAAFSRGGLEKVQSLQRNDQPDKSCWVRGNGWWLSTESAV